MVTLDTLPCDGQATMDKRGNIEEYEGEWDGEDEEDQDPYPAIYCYECGKQLRTVEDVELEEIHTAKNGEDVCEDCCVCARGWRDGGHY
jgi:hypothetical protein